jgi:hypothetical protein
MVDGMRKVIRDILSERLVRRKGREEERHRAYKREEKDIQEMVRYGKEAKGGAKVGMGGREGRMLTKIQQERVWKLLSRGMPSQNYNNLAKSLN